MARKIFFFTAAVLGICFFSGFIAYRNGSTMLAWGLGYFTAVAVANIDKAFWVKR